MSIEQAIVTAGGVSATGSKGKVGLVRAGGKEESVETTETIQRDDLIIVKERFF
jgi:protein involved in polysaccharide export with SLBB domain